MRRVQHLVVGLCVFAAVCSADPFAQSKPTLTPSDYDQFESLVAGATRGGLSPDGKWLAYGINRVGGANELRIAKVGDVAPVTTVAFGSQAVFSADMNWLAYGIGYSEEEQERMRIARTPIQRKLGIYNLTTNTETIIDGVETFAFDRVGKALAMKRYPSSGAGPAAGSGQTPPAAPATGRADGSGAPATPAAPIGTTLIIRDLATGIDTAFGNVSEFAWQPLDTGRLLAMAISAGDQAGNGIHLYNPATLRLRVLHASAADYSALVWRDDSADLVALRSKTSDKHDGPTHVATAWLSLGQPNETARTLDPTANGAEDLAGKRVVTFRRPSWLDGGASSSAMVMLGVSDWPVKPTPPTEGRAGGRTGGPGGGRGAAAIAANDKPDVDVWHWTDALVMPAQKIRTTADQRRNLAAVWHLASNRIITVGKSFDETITPIRGTTQALVNEFTSYLMDRSIGRGASDVLIADMATGTRTPLKTRVTGAASVSPTGKYLLYTEGGHYWTMDLATKVTTNITRHVKTSFVDVESDSTAPEKPMFGMAGWTKDDESVVLYDKFGVWTITPDGKTASDVLGVTTMREPVRYRYLRVDSPGIGAPAEPVTLSPAYFSIFDPKTKRSGYARTVDGQEARVVWLDKSVTGLAKAEKAEVFVYTVQAADDSPDLFTAGPNLRPAVQATETNAFASKFAWARAELVEYTVQPKGQPKMTLQGILHYPANYEPGKTYPMVVYLYEKLSDGMHRFQNPSERDYYSGTSLTQNGYFFFQPDIVFAPREPGVSVVECVSAAVKKVVDTGMVDATKVGVMGHSWGGFHAMYLSTHSKIFAAAISSAGISNLVSNYGSHHFSSGIAETDHIETGQQRMVVPLYEDLQAYIRNSAVFGISTMTTPMLLMTGDSDGTVYWHQSVEFYNIARRAKKNVVMLVYNGEDHGLRVKKNQIDYHRRIRQWFDHYLKGAAPEKWITAGVTALERTAR